MLYAYQLRAHANARYQESLISLAQKELRCMLKACGAEAEVTPRTLGGASFLCFEAELTPAQQEYLEGLSGLYMTAALEGELLRPLPRLKQNSLPQDMPDILKYKGKTNADFTQLMINLALAAGGQGRTDRPLILDPICGRGTTLFCAAVRGMDAAGIESDGKSLEEGVAFARRWLQYHRIKHGAEKSSHTLPGGRSAPETRLTLRTEAGEQTLSWFHADTREAGSLMKRRPAHALVADLPYGVQHAPRENGRMSTLEALLTQALPAWRQALRPGCAAAIAFNTYTLRRDTLARLAEAAGFTLPGAPEYADFSHWVEQAVQRDVLIALAPSK